MTKQTSTGPSLPILEVGQYVRVSMNSHFRAGCFGLVVEVWPEFPEYVGLAFGKSRFSLITLDEVDQEDVGGWALSKLDLSSVARVQQ